MCTAGGAVAVKGDENQAMPRFLLFIHSNCRNPPRPDSTGVCGGGSGHHQPSTGRHEGQDRAKTLSGGTCQSEVRGSEKETHRQHRTLANPLTCHKALGTREVPTPHSPC